MAADGVETFVRRLRGFGGETVGWLGLFALILFVPGLVIFTYEASMSRKLDPALYRLADELDAWPIATQRGSSRAQIVFLHHFSDDERPFLSVMDDESQPLSAKEVWSLHNRARLRWYRGAHGTLGIRQFWWYVDGHPDSLPGSRMENADLPRWLVVLVWAVCIIMIMLFATLMITAVMDAVSRI